jgi:hypothetical protein
MALISSGSHASFGQASQQTPGLGTEQLRGSHSIIEQGEFAIEVEQQDILLDPHRTWGRKASRNACSIRFGASVVKTSPGGVSSSGPSETTAASDCQHKR